MNFVITNNNRSMKILNVHPNILLTKITRDLFAVKMRHDYTILDNPLTLNIDIDWLCGRNM